LFIVFIYYVHHIIRLIKRRIQSMKFTFILRLMAVVALMTSLTPTKVEAFDFGSFMKKAAKSAKKFGKKAAGRMQKAAHGPLGQFALQAGGAAVSAKYGPEAGGMFQMASQSMHLADEHDAAADEAYANAQQAEEAGEMDTAAHHRSTEKTHRATAAYHREQHSKHKKAYEGAGGNFDDDYKELNTASKESQRPSENHRHEAEYDFDSEDEEDEDEYEDE
jgi:hypothetical protein